MKKGCSDNQFQDTPVFIMIISPEGKITLMSDSLLRALEYSSDEVIGSSVSGRLVRKNDRKAITDAFLQSIRSGESRSVETCFLSKSGGELYVRLQIQPMVGNDGVVEHLLGAGIDLTAGNKMGKEFIGWESLHMSLFRNSHIPILLINPRTGEIADGNLGACSFYGYTHEQIRGMKISEIDVIDESFMFQTITRIVDGEENHLFSKHRLADGSIRDVEVFCGAIMVPGGQYIYFIISDMTERKRMEEELMREREEQFLMFDSIPAQIFYKNRRNRYIRVNRAFSNFYGLPKKEIEGFTAEELFPENAEKSLRDDSEVIETGKSKVGILDLVETPAGPRWVQTDKLPFRDENGAIIGILGFSTDITEPKKAGEAIQALMESTLETDGRSFFDRIVHRICEWLGADGAFVGRILDGMRVQVISMHDCGENVREFIMYAGGTPLASVIEQGYVFYSENVGALFPRGHEFICQNPEGFVGMAIRDRDGRPVGVICAFSRSKLLVPKRAEEVMHIFASKASFEMERIQSDAALKESEERYRTLVETSPDAIVMTDLRGRFITANKQCALLFGVGSPEILVSSMNIFEFVNDRDRGSFLRNANLFVQNISERRLMVQTIQRKDGSSFPAEISGSLVFDELGSPRAFIGIIRDITERKEAERHLREEHSRLESRLRNERLISEISSLINSADSLDVVMERIAVSIMGNIPVSKICVFRYDPDDERLIPFNQWNERDDSVVSMNCACCEIYNSLPVLSRLKTGESIIIHSVSELDETIRNTFLERGVQALAVYSLGTDDLIKGAIGFQRDHEEEWKQEECTLFRIVADMIVNAIERDDNFQARIEAERHHAEAVKIAERSSRLASIGTLAAGISHEINQPLTALKVKVDSILYWQEMNIVLPPNDLTQDMRFISQQAERIDDIIKYMRALARQEKGRDPVEIHLNGIISEVLSLLRQRISSRGIQIELSLDETLPPIKGHKTLVHQVIINLLVNAVDAFNGFEGNKKMIAVHTYSRDDSCFLEVLDNGPGISESNLNQLFDPFFTTKIGSEGMGLGLSICYNIINGLGGVITVENRKEGGARFIASIPVSREIKGIQ